MSAGTMETKEVNRRFAASLRRERLAAAISQEEMAFRAGLHRAAIGHLERGLRTPTLGTIVKLAGGLGVSPRVLLEGTAWRPGAPGEKGHFEITPYDDEQRTPSARQ